MIPARLRLLFHCISRRFLPKKDSLIRVDKLRQEVFTHTDQPYLTYVLDGFQKGFCVGFNLVSVSLKSATQNVPFASLQPSVIDEYFRTELSKSASLALSLLPRFLTFISAVLESSQKNNCRANVV